MPKAKWRGLAGLAHSLVPLHAVHRDPKNARLHPEASIEAIKKSLIRFGQTRPIIIRKKIVVAGNGVHAAAEALGWPEIAVVHAEHMSAEEARAYAIVDNRLPELSTWDPAALTEALNSLDPSLLEVTSFSDTKLEELTKPPEVEAEEDQSKGAFAGMITFEATPEQAIIVRGAIAKIRETENDATITEGRCLELICASWMLDPNTVGP